MEESLILSLLSETIKNIVRYFRGDKKNIILTGMENSGRRHFYNRLKSKPNVKDGNECLKMNTDKAEYCIKFIKYEEDIKKELNEDTIIFFVFDIHCYMCDTLYQKDTNALLEFIYKNSKNISRDFKVILMGTHINEFFRKVLGNMAFAAGVLSDLPYNTEEQRKYFREQHQKYRQEEEDFKNNNKSNEDLKLELKDRFINLLRGKEYQKVSKNLIPINTNNNEEIDFVIKELLK